MPILKPLLAPLALLSLYAVWNQCIRLFSLSLMTFFMRDGGLKLQEVSEVFSANEIHISAISSLSFVVLLFLSYPLVTAQSTDILLTKPRLKKLFGGFLTGALIALAVVSSFFFIGFYKYFGFLTELEGASFTTYGIVIRFLSIVTLAVCEEYFYRKKIFSSLEKNYGFAAATFVVVVSQGFIRHIQFDFGLMQTFTQALITLEACFLFSREKEIAVGAGQLAGILVLFHVVFGLPFFGNEFAGIFSIKFLSEISLNAKFSPFPVYWLTGGSQGPLASVFFQMIFVLRMAPRILSLKT